MGLKALRGSDEWMSIQRMIRKWRRMRDRNAHPCKRWDRLDWVGASCCLGTSGFWIQMWIQDILDPGLKVCCDKVEWLTLFGCFPAQFVLEAFASSMTDGGSFDPDAIVFEPLADFRPGQDEKHDKQTHVVIIKKMRGIVADVTGEPLEH